MAERALGLGVAGALTKITAPSIVPRLLIMWLASATSDAKLTTSTPYCAVLPCGHPFFNTQRALSKQASWRGGEWLEGRENR